jgi:hypothetical protein
MKSPLKNMLEVMGNEALRANLSNTDWAARAGVRAETLSRLKQRGDCDLATLAALAVAVNLRVALVPRLKMSVPKQFDRDDEERLLVLCASRSLDLAHWRTVGSRFFTAGVAMLLASVNGFDRQAWLQLAEALYPGMGSLNTFGLWLKKSPLRPSRFLPMLAQRLA